MNKRHAFFMTGYRLYKDVHSSKRKKHSIEGALVRMKSNPYTLIQLDKDRSLHLFTIQCQKQNKITLSRDKTCIAVVHFMSLPRLFLLVGKFPVRTVLHLWPTVTDIWMYDEGRCLHFRHQAQIMKATHLYWWDGHSFLIKCSAWKEHSWQSSISWTSVLVLMTALKCFSFFHSLKMMWEGRDSGVLNDKVTFRLTAHVISLRCKKFDCSYIIYHLGQEVQPRNQRKQTGPS